MQRTGTTARITRDRRPARSPLVEGTRAYPGRRRPLFPPRGHSPRPPQRGRQLSQGRKADAGSTAGVTLTRHPARSPLMQRTRAYPGRCWPSFSPEGMRHARDMEAVDVDRAHGRAQQVCPGGGAGAGRFRRSAPARPPRCGAARAYSGSRNGGPYVNHVGAAAGRPAATTTGRRARPDGGPGGDGRAGKTWLRVCGASGIVGGCG